MVGHGGVALENLEVNARIARAARFLDLCSDMFSVMGHCL